MSEAKNRTTTPTSNIIALEHAGEISEAEYNAMLQEALDAREQKVVSSSKRSKYILMALCVCIPGAAFAWYLASPSNKAIVHSVWGETKVIAQDVKDGTDVGKMVEHYDEALEKIETHQQQTTNAAAALGADPTEHDAASQARLDQEMKKITGDARTTSERDAAIRKKFGKLAEEKRKEIEANRKPAGADIQ